MKKGKPLQRKTPLKAKTPMSRGTSQLKRSAPLKNSSSNGLTSNKGLTTNKPLQRNTEPVTRRGRDPKPNQKPRKPLSSKPPQVTPEERTCRKIVELRSDGFCEKCGCPGATDKAHRVSRGVGGGWEPSNILDLCRPCHQYNHANPTNAYDGGWHLRTGSTPTECPVTFHNEGRIDLAYLEDDGNFTWADLDPAESLAA